MKPNQFIIVFSFMVWLCQTAYSQSQPQRGVVQSNYLPYAVDYMIWSSDSVSEKSKPRPVIILLHGLNGNEQYFYKNGLFKQLDSLISANNLIHCHIVMPYGGNSYFINNYNESVNWESFFLLEFYPMLQEKLHADAENLFIGGFSMGGYGALVLFLKHPTMFKGCLAFNAALRTDSMVLNLSDNAYKYRYEQVFGNEMVQNRQITYHWQKNNPFHLLEKVNAPLLAQKNLFLSCPKNDVLITGNRTLHKQLSAQGIVHHYYEYDGMHNYKAFEQGFLKAYLHYFAAPE